MALEGTLRDFHIADIFQLIGLQKKTGVLTVRGEEDTVAITFSDGMVVWAKAEKGGLDDKLGSRLVKMGRITEAQLDEALKEQRETLQRLGYILVNHGYVTRQELQRAVDVGVLETLFRIFRWRDGTYQFVPQAAADTSEGQISPVTAEDLLLEGVRRIDEWPFIERHLPSLAVVVDQVPERVRRLARDRMTDPERLILERVDRPRTVQEIVDASGLGEFETCKVLASFVATGALAVVPRETLGPAPAAVAPGAQAAARPAPWAAIVHGGVAVGAALLLGVTILVFQRDPLGLIPLSEARQAEADLVRKALAGAALARLQAAIERHVLETGSLPASLQALADRGLVARADLGDPWGRPYLFRVSPPGYRLGSLGPDGQERTADDLLPDAGR
jgi:hypothetical protein